MKNEVHIIVSGRVQGVLFRDYTKRKARKFGLRGFVRNLKNGSVEIVAQGDKESINQLIEDVKKGSLPSKVEKVNVEWREPAEVFDRFEMILK